MRNIKICLLFFISGVAWAQPQSNCDLKLVYKKSSSNIHFTYGHDSINAQSGSDLIAYFGPLDTANYGDTIVIIFEDANAQTIFSSVTPFGSSTPNVSHGFLSIHLKDFNLRVHSASAYIKDEFGNVACNASAN